MQRKFTVTPKWETEIIHFIHIWNGFQESLIVYKYHMRYATDRNISFQIRDFNQGLYDVFKGDVQGGWLHQQNSRAKYSIFNKIFNICQWNLHDQNLPFYVRNIFQ